MLRQVVESFHAGVQPRCVAARECRDVEANPSVPAGFARSAGRS